MPPAYNDDLALALTAAGFVGEGNEYPDPTGYSYKIGDNLTLYQSGSTWSAIARDPLTGSWYTVTNEPGPWFSHLRSILQTAAKNATPAERIATMRKTWKGE